MTTASMKLVIINVDLADELVFPTQKLDDGEFIVQRVVELQDLYRKLIGKSKTARAVSVSSAERHVS